MAEQIIATQFHHEIRCSDSKCGTLVISRTVGRQGNQFALAREHATQRTAEGWRCFIGRSRRWYCPEHGPSAGSTMREDTSVGVRS